ncbi:hypothetical protein FRC02_011681 [Tulasnella sp. 418]|nr:hypothetical protein FRC02_011681 [Tulasnella sp. 418]
MNSQRGINVVRNQRKRAENFSSTGSSGSPSKKKIRARSPEVQCTAVTEHEDPLSTNDSTSPMPSTGPVAQAAQTLVENSRRAEGVGNEPVRHKPGPIQTGNPSSSGVMTSNAPLPPPLTIVVPPGYMLAYAPVLIPIPHAYVPATQEPQKK